MTSHFLASSPIRSTQLDRNRPDRRCSVYRSTLSDFVSPNRPISLFSRRPIFQISLSRRPSCVIGIVRRNLTSPRVSMSPENQFAYDSCVSAGTAVVALSLLRFWEEFAKRRIFDQKLNRKLVHISIGLVFMLFWPLFSAGSQASFLAALTPGINIIRMLLMGLGIWRSEATVKSISRHGHYRELLKGPLYYACTITLATGVFWRTSPIAIASICNLCAGDGVADIIGRRFGRRKLPHNSNKSFEGSIAMALAGFISSVGYMHYLSLFGFVQESWEMVSGFLLVSIASAIVESLPISTELDDNLTVPLTSLLVGKLVL